MEDNFNTGGTVYLDQDGKEITQQEHDKLQNKPLAGKEKPAVSGKKEVKENAG